MSSLSLSIPGLGTFPLSTFDSLAKLIPVVTKGIADGKSAEQIKSDLEAAVGPALLGFAERALNVIYPGTGTLLEAVAWLVENNKNSQMTQDEQNAWMDRFGIGTQS